MLVKMRYHFLTYLGGYSEKDITIYTMKYYLDVKKNEIFSFAMMWMDPGCITLSEISQSVKGRYHMISVICGIKEIEQILKKEIKQIKGKEEKERKRTNRKKLLIIENKLRVEGGVGARREAK